MIIAIESSCDESALALFDPESGLCGEWVHSQIPKHQAYGGIVPDLASREHLTNFPVLLKELLARHTPSGGDRIAVTAGPGLAGCLALGIALGQSLSLACGLPLCGVNHLRGHAWSPFIGLHAAEPETFFERFRYLLPHLGLIVSGGNTLLFRIDPDHRIRVLAETVDDAAGEALDKGAKLLGMPYPGGPLIEKAAAGGNPRAVKFPRAFPKHGDHRFSFSGLKTSLRYHLEKLDDATLEAGMADICASYQEAVVDALNRKTRQVLQSGQYRSLGLSGGVANNQRLRAAISEAGKRAGIPVHIAEPRHTGDNAGMIAFAAFVDAVGCREEPFVFDPSWELA
jgi:N6-L-threonylcarbamoyladenine synthase